MVSTESFSTDDGEEETPTDAPWVEEERKEFTDKLDTDHDGVLNDAEIQQWLAPSEKGFHEEEANHLLQHADKDKVVLNPATAWYTDVEIGANQTIMSSKGFK